MGTLFCRMSRSNKSITIETDPSEETPVEVNTPEHSPVSSIASVLGPAQNIGPELLPEEHLRIVLEERDELRRERDELRTEKLMLLEEKRALQEHTDWLASSAWEAREAFYTLKYQVEEEKKALKTEYDRKLAEVRGCLEEALNCIH